MGNDVYTIGHSTHPIAKFVELLALHNITAIADVRSSPFSQRNPHYNREALAKTLKANGIVYSFVGRELGARTEDRACYDQHGRARYDLIARTELFRVGLQRVMDGAAKYRLAMMCAEKDPMTCHRSLLVCRHLVRDGVAPHHILATGAIEEHERGLGRIAPEVGVVFPDLFRSDAEVFEDVYTRRSHEIEFVESRVRKEPA